MADTGFLEPTKTTEDASDTRQGTGPRTADEVLDRVRKAVPVLRERAAEIERERQLPDDVVQLLKDAGAFRMTMPRSWGGPELTSVQQTEVIETLATGDTSAAWCAMIGSDTGLYSGYLEDSVARSMFADLDTVCAGFIAPAGRAERVPGGYRVNGRWPFGSGITHSDWVAAGCLVQDGGTVEQDPEAEGPHWRIVLLPTKDVQILDTWYTTGLAGSGSRDYEITDRFVPEEHTFHLLVPRREGPLHAMPDAHIRNIAGVPLGVARAALDHVRALAVGRIDRATGELWSKGYRVQTVVARAEMALGAARSAVYTSLERQWERLEAGETLTADERSATVLARYHAFHTARSVVSDLYDLLGGSAIYQRRSPLDRWMRDLNTICQHAATGDQNLQAAGDFLLNGNPPSKLMHW
ncbi:acyl-CoA dehydrogenase family protein [Streptomyces sp. NPDC021093]|uniref:acyl-CoA dehydrogenase family protein n=1 Tax=Streptomyces sp. NPDC021093 TaxID=3365112 RepID=UPI0037873A68